MQSDDLIFKVADFLKDRDEAFIVSEEQTDEERRDSAAEIVAILFAEPLLHVRAMEKAARYHDNEAEYYSTRSGSLDGVPFKLVAHFHRLHAAAIRSLARKSTAERSFQERVEPWLNECFGKTIAIDKVERCDRFIEEALELIQAVGYGAERAHSLVDYVFNRPAGEPFQEVGGVEITLASLCLAVGIDKDKAGETELARVWTKVEKIRAKQAAKPTGSALPGPSVRDPDLVQHRLHWEGDEKPTEWREGVGTGLYPESPFLRIEVRKLYAGGQ